MSALEWVQELAQDGWEFWVEQGKLRYRAPRESAVAAVLERLRAHRDELLELAARAPDELAIGPLSYGQRALWFLWRLAPDSSAYHQSLPIQIPDHADPVPWQRAAYLLVARHPMLRTRFPILRGEPAQQVLSKAATDWSVTDARGWEEANLTSAMVAAHARPFDLTARPPLRFHWFARSEQSAVLLMTMHHVACDAWSIEILRRELAEIVRALSENRAWPALAPAHTYREFVRWQRAILTGSSGERLWNFWRDRLAEPRAQLDLPTDRVRPLVPAYRGDSVKIDIPDQLVARLRALASSRDVTRHVLMLTAYLVLLYRWTRQRDLVIGMPAAGRSQPEFAAIVGYFVETLVLRAAVTEDATFAGFLAEVKQASHDAVAHGDFPFALLVERLRVERDPSRSPIFDVTFNFLSRRAAASSRSGTADAAEALDIPQADGKFDLTLTVIDDDSSMPAALGFNTDLFERSTVERIAGHFVRILEEVTDNPLRLLDAIPLGASPASAALQGRYLDVDALLPVHRQILDQARRSPDLTAVVAEDGRLTYGELADRAGRLAARLVGEGVRSDMPVGLCCGRSCDFVVGMLGILQAGGAYLPLDPDLPPRLRDQMRARSGATVCVAGAGSTLAPSSWAVTIVKVDGGLLRDSSPRAHVVRSESIPSLDTLAYVIFTSGSTGSPKGVAVEHRSLANYVASIVEDLDIEPRAQHALASSIAADLGHTVLFPALVTGGTVHLLSQETLTDRVLFARYLSDQAIDYLKIVPSHLAALLGDESPTLPRRAVFLGGESSSSTWVARLRREGACRFFNHYGPTETTVAVLTFEARPERPIQSSTLPLDRAVANVSVWLLDPERQPVPPGVPGEVFVTGPALARGYIDDEDQTAARFVAGPGGARAYRTGDVARQLPDGSLLLLGREDRQLKLRGYRIELGQIEAALLENRDIRQAVVLPDRDGASASSLVACVVPAAPAGRAGLGDELRAWLAERLPDHMVPSRVAIVDRVPLTASGKMDVRALRAMIPEVHAPADRARPRDLVELKLCRIWTQVLGVAAVHPTDDFFQLGGHSLLAVRLASQIADEFGQHLPLATLFTHRTVERLATIVRAANPELARAPLIQIQPGGNEPPLILFAGAGGSLLYFQHLIAAADLGCPVWGAQPPGLGDDSEPVLDIPSIAATYADVIEKLHQPPQLIGHSFGGLIAFEVARQLRLREVPVAFLGILDNPAPGRDGTSDDDRDWLLHIATRIERLYGVDLGLDDEERAGSPARPDTWLVDRLLAAGILPPDTSRAYFARWVESYRSNVVAAARYDPNGARLDLPITVFKAAETDPALGRSNPDDDTLGWAAYSTQPVTVIEAPGSHITMLTEPHVRALGQLVRGALHLPARHAGMDGDRSHA